ncbi:MAG: hypothetical protein ACR2ME_10355 [Acidimicrobiia bacterium]
MFESLLGPTAVVDTMEVASMWPVDGLYQSVRGALSLHADLVGCHASHVYRQGACLYFTFVLTGSPDDFAVEERYRAAWEAGMRATTRRWRDHYPSPRHRSPAGFMDRR